MLTSLQNEQVKRVVSLHKRKFREETGLYLIEGFRFVEEAIRRHAPIHTVYVCPEKVTRPWDFLIQELRERGIPLVEVSGQVMRKMSATEEPQGILAVLRRQTFTWNDLQIDEDSMLLIVDGIQDPGNLGTILRTALAAGTTQICLTKGTVDLYSPKVLRSTMGTLFSLKVLTDLEPTEVFDFCFQRGLCFICGDVEGQNLFQTQFSSPLALVVGNEGNGPSEVFRSPVVTRVVIPMRHEVESLNVAIATGILLYEIVRQRVQG